MRKVSRGSDVLPLHVEGVGMRRDVTIRLEWKNAKKLEEAIAKGVFNELTQAQADAISEFAFELHCQVEEARS